MRRALALLLLALAPAAQADETLTVTPYGRYVLSFEAELSGASTIGGNPWYMNLYRVTAWWRAQRGCAVPYWSLTFKDANGTTVRNCPNFAQSFTCILLDGRHTYREEFIAPPGAATVTFATVAPSVGTMSVGSVTLAEVAEPDSRNVNPSFALGAHNLSGWNEISNGYVLPDPGNPGACRLVVGDTLAIGSARSDWIPVTPDEHLHLDYRFGGSATNRTGRVVVMTYADTTLRSDCQSDQLSKIFYLSSTNMTEGVYNFAVPSGITVLRLWVENAAVERLAVKEGWEE